MEVIDPDEVYESSAPNSRAVSDGDTIYISGVVGINPETGEYGDTIAEQTKYAFKNVEATLQEAGSSLDNILRILIFINSPESKSEMDEVYREYLDEPYPARATMFTNFEGEGKLEIVVTAKK